jgi:TetR/AcrR family transcriptional regulator, cholesterol catabolism regulator
METLSVARERVLQVAEALFMERGYTAVTLRDIADRLQMRQASLYHHVPGGKEALYVEVMERALARHRHVLEEAVQSAGPSLEAQIRAAARWFLDQPPMNYARMTRSDMPALSAEHARRLGQQMYESMFAPLTTMFRSAYKHTPLRSTQFGMYAGIFLANMEALSSAEYFSRIPRHELVDFVIDTMLHGIEA